MSFTSEHKSTERRRGDSFLFISTFTAFLSRQHGASYSFNAISCLLFFPTSSLQLSQPTHEAQEERRVKKGRKGGDKLTEGAKRRATKVHTGSNTTVKSMPITNIGLLSICFGVASFPAFTYARRTMVSTQHREREKKKKRERR